MADGRRLNENTRISTLPIIYMLLLDNARHDGAGRQLIIIEVLMCL